MTNGRRGGDAISAAAVKQRAWDLGFDLCGIAAADAFPELANLADWLARGYAGEMVYMRKSGSVRADIRRFLPSARSVIVTGTFYHPAGADRVPSHLEPEPADRVTVARYAQGDDYHVVLAARLDRLAGWLRAGAGGTPVETAAFVDKHHVQERVYAARAGLGWVGKNGCLIHPVRGSWFVIAGIACSLPMEADTPVQDLCGSCTICLDRCPTGALVEPRMVDARRCIAYLTIEQDGEIPESVRPAVGRHLFGCDICQEVCPWNLTPLPVTDPAWLPRAGRHDARAVDLWSRSDQDLHAFVHGSAMRHAPLARLRRNLAVAIGNSGDRSAVAALDRPGGGVRNAAHSATTPVVRAHVDWARRRSGEGGREPV